MQASSRQRAPWGASDFQIVTKVMLVEARTSLIVGATISLGTIFRIFRDGRNRRRRRTGRYCHPLWLHQMADRYHGCHSGASGNFIPDFPDDRNEDCESAGSQKVAITNLHIFLSFKEDTIMKKESIVNDSGRRARIIRIRRMRKQHGGEHRTPVQQQRKRRP